MLNRTARWLSIALTAFGILSAASGEVAASETHPWVRPPPRLDKETYFSNLKDGDSIETPFVAKFGLTGMGLAPAGKAFPKTGHHHLLINRSMPVDFTKPLPFSDSYMHFGKGQMEATLDFPPGKYQLRLLLADEKHIPNFVHSVPINVTVSKQNPALGVKTPAGPTVAILQPRPGETVKTPFRMAFHVSGGNVSSTALAVEGTGRFRLRLQPDGGREEVIDLTNGYTEVWLSPPGGDYLAWVEFVNNTQPLQTVASSESQVVKVVATGKRR